MSDLALTPRPARPAAVTLLVLGNPILGDDGLGARALAELEARWRLPPDLEVVDGGVGGLALLPAVEDARWLVILDAIEAERAPGALVELAEDEVPVFMDRATASPHQVGVSQVLALARLRGRLPERVLALGLQPGPLREGEGLCPALEAALPALVERLAARLRAWGIPLRARDAAAGPAPQSVRKPSRRSAASAS